MSRRRPARLARRWIDAATDRAPVATPQRWGAPATPVARLRAVAGPRHDPTRDLLDQARAQTDPLIAFGRDLHRRWPVDVIHAHTGLPDGIAARALAEALAVPLVTIEHDSKVVGRIADADVRGRYAELLGDRRALVAVSSTLGRRLATALEVDPAGIEVVPNPVDVDAFPLADQAGRDPDELLFVGRLRADKGIAALIEAFGIVRRTRPGLRLRLMGKSGPDDAETWRRLALGIGLGDSVRFETPADRAAVATAMGHAGLFVHPSPFETFGIVAAEALATGLPVATAPSGGVEEIVGTDGSLGEIATDLTAPALAVAIERLLARRTSLDPVRMRRSIVERFAADRVADRILAIDARLLGTTSPMTGRPAVARSEERTPSTPTSFEPPLIVGFRRRTLDQRFVGLAPDLRDRLPVLTTPAGVPTAGASASVPATWTEVDDDRAIRDALERLPMPPTAGLRAGRPGSSGIRSRPFAGAGSHATDIASAWRSAGRRSRSGSPATPVEANGASSCCRSMRTISSRSSRSSETRSISRPEACAGSRTRGTRRSRVAR